jgi:hypothetical protein
MFVASPVAGIANGFGLAGALDGISGDRGGLISLLICGAVVYLLVWIVFFVISLLIKRLKKQNKAIDALDRFGGAVLGICKWSIMMFVVFIVLFLLQGLPLVGNAIGSWLFENSFFSIHIYHLIETYVAPWIWSAALEAVGGLIS